MTCRDISQLCTEHAEGALSAERMRGFEQHLVACPPCEVYVQQMRLARDVTASLPPATDDAAELSEGRWAQLVGQFRAAHSEWPEPQGTSDENVASPPGK